MNHLLQKRILALFLLVASIGLTSTQLYGQKERADSCAKILAKNPENRKARRTYVASLRKINADSAFEICKTNAARAEKIGDLRTAGDWNYYAAITLDQLQRNKEAKPFFIKGLEQLGPLRDTFSLDDCQNSYGYLLLRMGEYKESLKNLQEALAYREFVDDTMGKAGSHLNIGLLYNNIGDYSKALDNYFKCIEYAHFYEESDPGLMGKVLNNIGTVYMNQHKNEDALKFFWQALVYKTKAGNKKDLASTYNNIGSIYSESNADSALYYFNISLTLRTEANDYRGLGIVHKNIGEVYVRQKKYKEAEVEFRASLEFREKVNDQSGIASTLTALGKLKTEQGKYSEALVYLRRSDSICQITGSLSPQLDVALAFWSLYKSMGNPGEALQYADKALKLKDSLLNESSLQHGEEMRARYDMDIQARELDKLKTYQRELEIKTESERSFYQVLIISGIVILFLVVLFFMVRARENRKSQSRLQFAYDQIETKNKDITDSIRYAKRIQQAILPDDISLKQAFPKSFVFYRPKDIVSGDFYWHHHSEEVQLVAVADCTGHGVPGAFMSVLGASQLTSVISEQGEVSPSRILHLIDEGMRNQLHQDGLSAMHDSMDIAICAYHRTKRQLIYTGANRPIILFRADGSIEICRPAKHSVGGDSETAKNFTEQVIQLEEGDSFYLFTDGFADQFGGPKGKKFKSSRFRDVLQQIALQDIRNQKRELELVFDSWKGQFEQVDDICVIGIRV